MTLTQITSSIFLAAINVFDQTGRERFLSKYGFGGSLKFVLLHEGLDYDSGAIAGVVHSFVDSGNEASAHIEFSGGDMLSGIYSQNLGS